MTRKHYIAIAASFMQAKMDCADILGSSYCIRAAALRVANELAADNPRFDRERFLTACGFPQVTA